MKKIYSKIKGKKLLHIVFSPTKKNQRINVSQENEFMQLCYLNLNKKNKFLTSKTLKPGDVSITFEGGHKLDILKDNTVIYEHKNGPYEGQKKDLRYIKSY